MAGERIEHAVLERFASPGGEVAAQAARDVGERRDDEPGMHGERTDVGGQAAEAVDDRLRFEHAIGVGEQGERLAVEPDAELLVERGDKLGVDDEAALELEFEVGPVADRAAAADRERAQQHGRGKGRFTLGPSGKAHRKVHRIDAADGAKLDVLGGDRVGGTACLQQRDLVAEQVRKERRLPGNKRGQATRVRLGDVDPDLGHIAIAQQRRTPTDGDQFGAQPLTLGISDVCHRNAGLGDGQVVGCYGRA